MAGNSISGKEGARFFLPPKNVNAVPAVSLKGKIVQGTDQSIYYSRLTPGTGYEWVKLKDETNAVQTITIGPNGTNIPLALDKNIGKYSAIVLEVEDGLHDVGVLMVDLGEMDFVSIRAASDFPAAGTSFVTGSKIGLRDLSGKVTSLMGGGTRTISVSIDNFCIDFVGLGVRVGDEILAWSGSTSILFSELVVEAVEGNVITTNMKFPPGIGTVGNGFVIKPRVKLILGSENMVKANSNCVIEFHGVHIVSRSICFGQQFSNLTVRFSETLVEGEVNVVDGSSFHGANSSIIGSSCLVCGGGVDVLMSTFALIQSDSTAGFLALIFNSTKMEALNLSIISVNRQFILVACSSLNVSNFFVISRGLMLGTLGLVSILNGSTFSGSINRIEQTGNSHQHALLVGSGSRTGTLSGGSYSAGKFATSTIESNGGNISVSSCCVNKAGGGVLFRSRNFGKILAAALTNTGGILLAQGGGGGVDGTVIVGSGNVVGSVAGLMGNTTTAASQIMA